MLLSEGDDIRWLANAFFVGTSVRSKRAAAIPKKQKLRHAGVAMIAQTLLMRNIMDVLHREAVGHGPVEAGIE